MQAGKGAGANSYWPGFVDALTNVVIAMIFVIVVLAISLSFAAQLMGKKVAEEYIKRAAIAASAAAPSVAGGGSETASAEKLASAIPESSRSARTRIPVAGNESASMPSGGRLAPPRNILQLDFAPKALTLDTVAAEQLKLALVGVSRAGRAVITGNGPDMSLSANLRASYLRVMAVRNVLLEQGFAADRISVHIETKAETRAPAVNVSFGESK